jgi:hypothetical protein
MHTAASARSLLSFSWGLAWQMPIVVCIMLALSACNNAAKPANLPPPAENYLGKLSITTDGANVEAMSVRFEPNALIPSSNINILPGATSSVSVGLAPNTKHFVNAGLTVQNLSGMILRNVILIAYNKTGNLNNSALGT